MCEGPFEWYYKWVREAEKKHPELENRTCVSCGFPLVKASVGYYEGFHFDGCPNQED